MSCRRQPLLVACSRCTRAFERVARLWQGSLIFALLMALVPDAIADEAVEFARDVQPIFTAHCVTCHGAEKQESGLRLDFGATVLAGGNSGPAVRAGKAADSLLMQAITGQEGTSAMPPEGPRLSAAQIDVIRRWIDQGAVAPQEGPQPTARPTSEHWAFQPMGHAAPPPVKQSAWIRNGIDAFVLARLEADQLAPSPEADRSVLLRRASLDLTGLPPTLQQISEFQADTAPGAYERMVDRLLASPRYGERWGRHWLDIARYADSNGYTIDGGRSIWKYRDWVIDALNRDLPFDRFTIEQLAGDLLPGSTLDQQIATGFHRNTLVNEEGGTDPEQFRVEAVVDRVSTTGSAFLGLTLGCARCHDHKYDPISQRDFYQMFAIFNNCDEPVLSLPTTQQAKELPALVAELQLAEKRLGEVDANAGTRQAEWERISAERLAAGTDEEQIAKLTEPLRAVLRVPPAERNEEQRKLLQEEYRKIDPERVPLATRINELKQQQKQMKSAITSTLVMRERATPRETAIHVRGDFLHPGAAVAPAGPAILPPIVPRGERVDRLDLARWLVAPGHPLTARVTVNRVWQVYFGQGLVGTENDFGLQGDRPSHPELLDWLARTWIDQDWSLKALHRMIVTSATYRQASQPRGDLAAADPYNKLLGRQQRLRLEAEVIRDAALAASGLLSDEIGGPGVYPPQPEGIYRFTQQVKFWGENKDADRYRRGMYTYFWRSSPYPFLKTFDAPDAVVACTRRARSNTPLQALTIANDRAFFEIAQGFAASLLVSPAAEDETRLRLAFARALVRQPTSAELATLTDYLHTQRASFAMQSAEAAQVAPTALAHPSQAADAAAWTMVARVLLNLDEFITRE